MERIVIAFFVLVSFLSGKELGVYENLGGKVPLDLSFTNERNQTVTFRQLMDGKPAILTLNYYGCPGICNPQLYDLARTLAKVELAENGDYKVITLSFDPEESVKEAARKKREVLASMGRPYVAQAWTFLTGSQKNIAKITDATGFRYEKRIGPDGKVNYLHPAVLIALSPEGKITRYLNGINQLPFDIQLALLEAAEGTVRPTVAKTLLFCFAYDPENKRYVFAAEKVGAIALSLALFGFFLYLALTGRKKRPPEDENG